MRIQICPMMVCLSLLIRLPSQVKTRRPVSRWSHLKPGSWMRGLISMAMATGTMRVNKSQQIFRFLLAPTLCHSPFPMVLCRDPMPRVFESVLPVVYRPPDLPMMAKSKITFFSWQLEIRHPKLRSDRSRKKRKFASSMASLPLTIRAPIYFLLR